METAMKITCCCRTQWANRWTFSQLFSVVMSILKSTLMFSWWNCLTNNTTFNWVIGMFIDTSIKWLCPHELLAGPNIPNMSLSLSDTQTQFILCLTSIVLDKSDRSCVTIICRWQRYDGSGGACSQLLAMKAMDMEASSWPRTSSRTAAGRASLLCCTDLQMTS